LCVWIFRGRIIRDLKFCSAELFLKEGRKKGKKKKKESPFSGGGAKKAKGNGISPEGWKRKIYIISE